MDKISCLHHRHDDASDGVWFMTSLDEPKIPLNLPTPLLAIWERVLIALFMLGVIVLAITIQHRETASRYKEGLALN